MVNEDRVKQLYKIAAYEKNEEKLHRQAGQYYRSDYIWKEVLKSIITGTCAYAIMAVLWMMSNWSLVLYQINTLEIVDTILVMLVFYIGFMVIYLFATVTVYFFRYKNSVKKVTGYVEDLKVAHSMFDREEKLKV